MYPVVSSVEIESTHLIKTNEIAAGYFLAFSKRHPERHKSPQLLLTGCTP